MKSPHFDSSPKTNATTPAASPPKVPRLDSLHHRLQRAKDPDGQPIPLLDELLFFLDDPPPGTRDRWQDGAELCATHRIKTSRMSVWRFYRAHILQWRRDQNPAPPPRPPTCKQTARLLDQARHLAAQRALETINDPHLSPGHLIGFLQNDNHRQKLQLARDQFNDRVNVRQRHEQRDYYQRLEKNAREEASIPVQLDSMRKLFTAFLTIPPDTTK